MCGGGKNSAIWFGKPDTFGWEIYPNMFERRRSWSILNGMGVWKVLKFCGSAGQRAALQPLWILWISKVHRRLTMPSTRWETGTFGLTTMNPGQCLVLFGASKTAPPRAVETLQDSLGGQLVQCLAHLCPFTPERDVMNGE